jgi:hypothetical protein
MLRLVESTGNNFGWRGKNVRHQDGRTGRITSEYVGFDYVGLTFKLSDGTEHYVELHCIDKNRYVDGWQWFCSNFVDGPHWLAFGE